MEIGSVLGVRTQSDGSVTGLGSGTLGKQEFLELLLTQLQMQDPFEPLDNEAMIAQLAQFSSLEQLANMNTSLDNNLEMDLVLGQLLNNTMATTLIGREVTVAMDSFHLGGGGSADLGYRLAGGALEVTASVYDAADNLVAEIEGLPGEEGDHTFSWDGTDLDGDPLPAGVYRFSVSANAGDETPVHVLETIVGVVDGVRYRDGNARLVLGEDEVFMSDVLQVTQKD
ncbi:MAG: flagellar hook capping FlgD N-terminal domain-containing protein [Candidatus Eisenbacteria bacterium]